MPLFFRISLAVLAVLLALLLALPFVAVDTTRWVGVERGLEMAVPGLELQEGQLSTRINPWTNRLRVSGRDLHLVWQDQGLELEARRFAADLQLSGLLTQQVRIRYLEASDYDLRLTTEQLATNEATENNQASSPSYAEVKIPERRPNPAALQAARDLRFTNTSQIEAQRLAERLNSLRLMPAVRLRRGTVSFGSEDETERQVWQIERLELPARFDGLASVMAESLDAESNTQIALDVGIDALGHPNRVEFRTQGLRLADFTALGKLLDSELNLGAWPEVLDLRANLARENDDWFGELELRGTSLALSANAPTETAGLWQLEAHIAQPTRLAALHPALSELRHAHLGFDLSGEVSSRDLWANLSVSTFESGVLAFEQAGLPPFSVASLSGQLFLDRERVSFEEIQLVTGTADWAGPQLSGGFSLSLPEPGEDARFSMQLYGPQIQAQDLFYLWPTKAAEPARTQADRRFLAGTAYDARLELTARIPAGGGEWQVEEFLHTTRFEEASVLAHEGLVLTEGKGELTIIGQTLEIELEQAQLGGMDVRDGTVTVNYEVRDETRIQANFDLDGPLEEGLPELLEADLNLDFMQDTGLDQLQGRVSGKVGLDLWIIREGPGQFATPSDSLRWAVDLESNQLTHPDFFGLGATVLEEVQLDLNERQLSGSASGRNPAGLNTTFRLSQNIEQGEDLRIEGDADFSSNWLSEQFEDAVNWLDGEAEASFSLNVPNEGGALLNLTADLSQASLRFPGNLLDKAPGEEANLELELDFGDQDRVLLRRSRLWGQGFQLEAEASFASNDLDTLVLTNVSVGDTRLPHLRVEKEENLVRFSASGGVVDLRPLLSAPGVLFAETGTQESQTYLMLVAEPLDRLLLDEGDSGYVTDVRGDMLIGPNGLENSALRARLPGNESEVIELNLTEHEGTYHLRGRTADAGSFLRALGASSSVRDGDMLLSGESPYPLGGGPWIMRMRVDAFRLKDAPVLAQVLSAISITGLLENLSGSGLYFDSLDTSLRFSGSELALGHLRLVGTSLGISSQGLIDMDANQISLDGTVAPFNIINMLAGQSFIGSLLTGARGEGVIAPQYSLRGQLDDPEISVNPLTTFTLGALRETFGGNPITSSSLDEEGEANSDAANVRGGLKN